MNQNTYRSFELAFQYGDVLLQTEEDSLLSPDWAWYCVSMLRQYEKDDEVLYISHSHNNLNDERLDKVFRFFGAFVAGVILWKNKSQWFLNNWIPPSYGQNICYDTWFDRQIPKDKAGIIPVVCRARHIGENDGTYASPQMVRDAYINLYAGDFSPVTKWEEIDTLPLN
jgi:hypothetical protein